MNHLGLKTLTIGSRWADAVNEAIIRYLEAGGIKVVGITKRNQWAAEAFAMSLEEGLKLALDVGREAAKLRPRRMPSRYPEERLWLSTSFRLWKRNSASRLSRT